MPFVATQGFSCRVGDTVAALRLHGVFATQEAADAAAQRLASEQPDVPSYVVDRCWRWLQIHDPVAPDAALETAEVDAPENNDPRSGRMGSVCVGRSAPRSTPAPNCVGRHHRSIGTRRMHQPRRTPP